MTLLHRSLAGAVLAVVITTATAGAQRPVVDTAAASAAGEQAALRWLAMLDSGRYAESYDSAALALRVALTRPAWQQALAQARNPFEPFGDRRLLGARYLTQLPNAPPGVYVVIQYRTAVGGGRWVIETVTPMQEQDGAWRVGGYFVRPE